MCVFYVWICKTLESKKCALLSYDWMYFDVESHWNHTSVKSFEDEMLAEMIECAGNKDKALYDTVKPTNRADLIYFTE